MNLTLTRIFKAKTHIIGHLSIDGEYFCDTLELPEEFNGKKNVREKTCIPEGVYSISVCHSPTFGRMLPRLSDVPGRDGILIHRGNTAKNTHGCILVGTNDDFCRLAGSTGAEKKLMERLQEGGPYRITIE